MSMDGADPVVLRGIMKKPNKRKSRQGVLADHKKIGKTLLPPMLHQIQGGLSTAHYDRDTLPEIIWLALVEESHGIAAAAKVAADIGHYVKNCESKCHFIMLSEMPSVKQEEWHDLRAYLTTTKSLSTLLTAVHDFVVLYPECPLVDLFEQRPITLRRPDYLLFLETFVGELLHKRGRRSVLMQANSIYLLGCQGKLSVAEGCSLGNFEALANYPETEESRKVGASVCAASFMLTMVRQDHEIPSWSWVKYFWNHNLELKPIKKLHLEYMHE